MGDTAIKEPKEKPRQNQPMKLPSEKQQREKDSGEHKDKPAREDERAAALGSNEVK